MLPKRGRSHSEIEELAILFIKSELKSIEPGEKEGFL